MGVAKLQCVHLAGPCSTQVIIIKRQVINIHYCHITSSINLTAKAILLARDLLIKIRREPSILPRISKENPKPL